MREHFVDKDGRDDGGRWIGEAGRAAGRRTRTPTGGEFPCVWICVWISDHEREASTVGARIPVVRIRKIVNGLAERAFEHEAPARVDEPAVVDTENHARVAIMRNECIRIGNDDDALMSINGRAAQIEIKLDPAANAKPA